MERFPIPAPVGAELGLWTQPRYESPNDLRVKVVKTQWLTLVQWGCLCNKCLKLAMGQPNNNLKKQFSFISEWVKLNNQIACIFFRKWLSIKRIRKFIKSIFCLFLPRKQHIHTLVSCSYIYIYIYMTLKKTILFHI